MLIFCTLKKVMFFIDENINNWSQTITGNFRLNVLEVCTQVYFIGNKIRAHERWEKNEVLKRKYGFLNPMIRTGSLVVGLKGVRCREGGSCWDLFELNFLQT